MRRLAVLTALVIFLFLGLVISNLLEPVRVAILGVETKKDVFVMFVFGAATLVFLSLYDVYAAFGSFRRRRDLQKQLDKLESELLSDKHKTPPPASY